MKYVMTSFLLMLAVSTTAQKRDLIQDNTEIERRAMAELDSAMRGPEGPLYKAVVKENLTGVYRLQISLSDKGDIRSVQVLDRQGGDIPSQNRIKQLVHDSRFTSFKTPKGKQYRFEHTFDLDALHR